MSACVVNQSTLHHRHFSIIMKHKIHILAIDDKKIVGGSRLHRGAFLESFHYFMTIIFDAGNVQQSIKHNMGSCSSSIYFTSNESSDLWSAADYYNNSRAKSVQKPNSILIGLEEHAADVYEGNVNEWSASLSKSLVKRRFFITSLVGLINC